MHMNHLSFHYTVVFITWLPSCYESIGTHYYINDYRLFATALYIPIRLQLKSCWFHTSNRVLN